MSTKLPKQVIVKDRSAPAKALVKPKQPVKAPVKLPVPQQPPSTAQKKEAENLLAPKKPPVSPPIKPVVIKEKTPFSLSAAPGNLAEKAIANLVMRTHDTPQQAAKFLYAGAARYDQDNDISPRLRQDVSPASGQGVDACGLYGNDVPSLVYACRMGLVPEPRYEILFFSGVNTSEDDPLQFEGPPPEVQAPLWANWATQTYRYPGVSQPSRMYETDPNFGEYLGKEGQAYRASQANQEITSSTYLIVVGYSAGADAALMFASRYDGPGRISDVIMLGPTMSGGLSSEGLSATPVQDSSIRPSIRDNNQWQTMIEGLLDQGVDVFTLNDSAGDDPTYTNFNPTGRLGNYRYDDRTDTLHWDVTPAPGSPNQSPAPINQSIDLWNDVIDWINIY